MSQVVREWQRRADLGPDGALTHNNAPVMEQVDETIARLLAINSTPMPTMKIQIPNSLPCQSDSRTQRLTVKIPEAAAILGVSCSTIRRAIERGDIRANRKLRHVLIPMSEIERFAAA